MKRWIAILALLALPLAAQESKQAGEAKKVPLTPAQAAKVLPPKAEQLQKLFVLKYADPGQLTGIIRIFSGNVMENSSMRTLAVSATPAAMAAIEEAIKRLDVPAAAPQSIDLLAYFVYASLAADPDQGAMPTDIINAVSQLRVTFPYKSYRVADTMAIRALSGHSVNTSSVWATAPASLQLPATVAHFQANSVSVDSTGSIRLDRLSVGCQVPFPTATQAAGGLGSGLSPLVTTSAFGYNSLGINTDVEMKEGQKIVVGKMGVREGEAIFLVLIAKAAQ